MTPTSAEIRAAREAAGLTQAAAAALVHVDARTWRRWESAATRMRPAIWQLYRIKTEEQVGDLIPALPGTQR